MWPYVVQVLNRLIIETFISHAKLLCIKLVTRACSMQSYHVYGVFDFM